MGVISLGQGQGPKVQGLLEGTGTASTRKEGSLRVWALPGRFGESSSLICRFCKCSDLSHLMLSLMSSFLLFSFLLISVPHSVASLLRWPVMLSLGIA